MVLADFNSLSLIISHNVADAVTAKPGLYRRLPSRESQFLPKMCFSFIICRLKMRMHHLPPHVRNTHSSYCRVSETRLSQETCFSLVLAQKHFTCVEIMPTASPAPVSPKLTGCAGLGSAVVRQRRPPLAPRSQRLLPHFLVFKTHIYFFPLLSLYDIRTDLKNLWVHLAF